MEPASQGDEKGRGRRRAGKGAAPGAAAAAGAPAPCRPRIRDAAAAARTREMLPRLEYARFLLGDACAALSAELPALLHRSRRLAAAAAAPGAAAPGRSGIGHPADPHLPLQAALADELAVRTAVLALSEAAAWLARAGRPAAVTDAVPAAIPVLRHVSSALYAAHPAQSALLCEASSVLGGVLADSAAASGARLDFGRHNADSAAALAQAKLTAGSNLRKLHPDIRGAHTLAVTRACCC